MTHRLLPLLLNRSHPSAIINLSSVLGQLPCPFNPIYGATKAFNRTFSRALTAEYAHQGLQVLSVCPGLVQSQLTGLGEDSWLAVGAEKTAEGALAALGVEVECYPHLWHGLTGAVAAVAGWMPEKLVTVAVAMALRFLPKPPGIKVSAGMRVR